MVSSKHIDLNPSGSKSLDHFKYVYVHPAGILAASLAQGTSVDRDKGDTHKVDVLGHAVRFTKSGHSTNLPINTP